MDIAIKVKLGDLKNSIQDQLAKYEVQFDAEIVDTLNDYGIMITILYGKGIINLETYKQIGNTILEKLKFHLYQFNPDITLD